MKGPGGARTRARRARENTVALRACISMREDSEKGELEKRKSEGGRNAERGTEGKKASTRYRSGRTSCKKVGKKGLFELSLCAKQLLRPSERTQERAALCSSTCRPIGDTERRRIDAARKCRSSFSPIVSSLIIERCGGRESKRAERATH